MHLSKCLQMQCFPEMIKLKAVNHYLTVVSFFTYMHVCMRKETYQKFHIFKSIVNVDVFIFILNIKLPIDLFLRLSKQLKTLILPLNIFV